VYITDGTGGNLADVVNVNHQGHLSVHLADGGLPAFTGPLYARHIAYPNRHGLKPGQCYAAYVRGGGTFIGASIRFGQSARRPDVLVRLDPNPIWVETGGPNSTPSGLNSGFTHSGNSDTFAYTMPLSFKSFAGVMLCWHGQGRSTSFAVQMTLANGDSNPYLPEEMTFHKSGSTLSWTKLQGPAPLAYQAIGTQSTLVSYYQAVGPPLRQKLPPLHKVGKRVVFVPHQLHFSEKLGAGKASFARYYVFEIQPNGDPTRVGPFGSFSGE
jgi:hypothetical protein